jgi:hypothetical protein
LSVVDALVEIDTTSESIATDPVEPVMRTPAPVTDTDPVADDPTLIEPSAMLIEASPASIATATPLCTRTSDSAPRDKVPVDEMVAAAPAVMEISSVVETETDPAATEVAAMELTVTASAEDTATDPDALAKDKAPPSIETEPVPAVTAMLPATPSA